MDDTSLKSFSRYVSTYPCHHSGTRLFLSISRGTGIIPAHNALLRLNLPLNPQALGSLPANSASSALAPFIPAYSPAINGPILRYEALPASVSDTLLASKRFAEPDNMNFFFLPEASIAALTAFNIAGYFWTSSIMVIPGFLNIFSAPDFNVSMSVYESNVK
ncbi:MAG: hypothetical protein BWY84_01145 [Candidatus Aerophobetes bacterium ADurb.Bin490]|nr:MAG: hypothetical protein BWY84_01145 [Candidatus Aerophobetes bacterium ADurb.Bin490]